MRHTLARRRASYVDTTPAVAAMMPIFMKR
jgi:hypothetical protein